MTTQRRPSESTCWQAVLARDARHDGRFYFGVVTTGVYCRPSCPARRPLRKNVRFYATAGEAASAGLRPCRRCRPGATANDAPGARLRELCDYIRLHSDSGTPLTLAALSRRAGMSPSHLQRTFRAAVGVTPKDYVEACRVEALKHGLRAGESVTQAIYDAGFGSSSRVYERADTRLGMTPGEYRSGGANLEISYASAQTRAGRLMMAATDRGLCFVQFADSDEALLAELRQEYPAATLRPMRLRHTGSGSRQQTEERSEQYSEQYAQQFAAWMAALRAHLDGKLPALDLPLAVSAPAFRLAVWRYLQTIPYGEVRSYSEVAAGMGRPGAVRAVASACAANRLALVIPCHRVIRANGEPGDYRWGAERKRLLLARERTAGAAAGQ